MKRLRKIIQEEVKKLQEEKYPLPDDIKIALEDKLEMYPLIRYVKHVKALNSIPPSYEIFLNGGRSFVLFYEDFSLMAKIQGREYYLLDLEDRSNAKEHINRMLMVQPVKGFGDEEEGEEGGEEGEEEDTPTPTPPKTPSPQRLTQLQKQKKNLKNLRHNGIKNSISRNI